MTRAEELANEHTEDLILRMEAVNTFHSDLIHRTYVKHLVKQAYKAGIRHGYKHGQEDEARAWSGGEWEWKGTL